MRHRDAGDVNLSARVGAVEIHFRPIRRQQSGLIRINGDADHVRAVALKALARFPICQLKLIPYFAAVALPKRHAASHFREETFQAGRI
jgi:hypothetical protein